jgi:hypothetical protein
MILTGDARNATSVTASEVTCARNVAALREMAEENKTGDPREAQTLARRRFFLLAATPRLPF